MGYYSTLNIETIIKEENIKDVRGILAGIKLKISANIAKGWEIELDLLILNDDGVFEIGDNDWYTKWYHEEKWIEKLAPFFENGDIEFTGEEGEKYGYRIINGIAYNLYFRWKRNVGGPLVKIE